MARNWAVTIGINGYRNLQRLKYAVRDAEAVQNFFRQDLNIQTAYYFSDNSPPIQQDYGPTLDSKPTYTSLRRFLRVRFEEPFLQAGDNLWFFFAGHGIRHQDRDYLMPIDGDPGDVGSTGIPLHYISERLRRSGADNIVMLIDACRDDLGKRSGIGIGEEKQQGVVTLFSCSPQESSYEIDKLQHGVFTYVLLESLRIKGEENCATVERLYQRLRQRVPQLSQQYNRPKQIPYGVIEPPTKYHLILLQDKTRASDVIALKNDALQAEVQRNFKLAEQLWIRILEVSPADSDAVEAIARLTRISNIPESLPQPATQQSSQLSRGTFNQSPGGFSSPRKVPAMTDHDNHSTRASEIEELINEFRNNRDRRKWVIPVCGSGFSKHIVNQNYELPNWKQLTESLLQIINCSTELDRIRIVGKARDYLTALTLIQKCDPRQFDEYLQAQFQNEEIKRLGRQSLPVHMSLWSIGFPLIITTNFDDLLSKARPIAEVYSYQSIKAEQVIQEALEGEHLKPVIFHAHGRITDDRSTENIPLLTWREYFRAYGINDSKKDSLVTVLTDDAENCFARKSERESYKEILEDVLKESWRSISPTRSNIVGTRLPDILDDLLTKHTLFLIGFSLDDPSWKLLLLTILAKYGTYPTWSHYYITKSPDEPAPAPGFKPITLKNWKDLYSVLNTLAVGIYDEKDSKGKYIKGGAENEARNREAKYLSFGDKYPTLKWIFWDEDSLIPFVELWFNETFGRVKISVEAAEKTWQLDTELDNLRDEYWKYREDKSIQKGIPLTNERKVRVNSWRKTENGICLSVEPVEYKDYLITNHMIANIGESELSDIAKYDGELSQRMRKYFSKDGDFSPRNVLCKNEREIALHSNTKCSNHLGVSALIIGNFEAGSDYKIPVIFCPPSTRQISSPNDIIPSVSGSVDWPVKRDAKSEADIYSLEELKENPNLLNIDKELKREFIEECRWELLERIEKRSFGYKHHVVLDRHADYEVDELMSNQVLINLCQNIERGGKPELFYLFTLKEEISMNSFLEEHFEPNWELEKLWTPILDEVNTDYLIGPPGLLKIFLLPSPLGIELNLDHEYKKAFELIYRILNNPGYNPVLRAHLSSLLLFCKRKFPDIKQGISTIAPNLGE